MRVASRLMAMLVLLPALAQAGVLDRLVLNKDKQLQMEREAAAARARINAVAWPLLTHPNLLAQCEGGRPAYGFRHRGTEGYELERKQDQDLEAMGWVPRQVLEVYPGSPAEAAGLQVGDVIVGFDGRRIRKNSYKGDNRITELLAEAREEGRAIELEVERSGARQVLRIEPVRVCDFEAILGGTAGIAGAHDLPRKLRARAIMVDIGLYRLVAEDEALLQAVIVHELAHQFLDHYKVRGMAGTAARVTGTAMEYAGMGGTPGLLLKLGTRVAFKAGEEREADLKALELMRSLDLNPEVYVAFVHRLAEARPDLVASGVGAHPVNEERLAALRAGGGQG
ncbi:MAG: hypothetical protein KatS3mg126_0756 [Lysobacteraceae bacterium]|nr:MAG: hypothetical protein KatS3mg126_0756 [Xanthomonadaceae bacterium]